MHSGGLAGHMVSVEAPQLSWGGENTAWGQRRMNARGRISVNLYLQKQTVGQIWPACCSLLTPGVITSVVCLGCLAKFGCWY